MHGISQVVGFLCRRIVVRRIVSGYLGLDGLFSSILSLFLLVECGMGQVLIYRLYGPLSRYDWYGVSVIVGACRRLYRTVSCFAAVCGILATPFILKQTDGLEDVVCFYLFYVIEFLVQYFCMHRKVLVEADQNGYVVSLLHYGLNIFSHVGQAVTIFLACGYWGYVFVKFAAICLEQVFLVLYTSRRYSKVDWKHRTLFPEVPGLYRETGNILAHYLGDMSYSHLVTLAVSIVMGSGMTGICANYILVRDGVLMMGEKFFGSVQAGIGNMGAKGGVDEVSVFYRILNAGGWLYGMFSVCLVVLLNPFIVLWLGEQYCLSDMAVLAMVAVLYVQGIRRTARMFRDQYGLYQYCRKVSVAHAILNAVLVFFGAWRWGVAGAFFGQAIVDVFIRFWSEPLSLVKGGIPVGMKCYFLSVGKNTIVTCAAAVLAWVLCGFVRTDRVVGFVMKMVICGLTCITVFVFVYWRSESAVYYRRLLVRQIERMRHGK